ncbi:hypothetical protein K458DRAFT_403739 [Lentithecium fluviatile CBS 122367]|uniref:Uncharacterized protein n=1 Tax=Lentithecium fluviatile CBS 122367 TaxID=1168545 RepID=A0A6G1J3G0_9PLEO|nr:hypothetical protein K458DRAFT_403739 [Lentithecium fluviatile CBS 122367]
MPRRGVTFQFRRSKKKEKKRRSKSGERSRNSSQASDNSYDEIGQVARDSLELQQNRPRGSFGPCLPTVQNTSSAQLAGNANLDHDGYAPSPPASLLMEEDPDVSGAVDNTRRETPQSSRRQATFDNADDPEQTVSSHAESSTPVRPVQAESDGAVDHVSSPASTSSAKSSTKSGSPRSPRWAKVVSLIAGRRRSSTGAAKKVTMRETHQDGHRRRATEPSVPLQRVQHSSSLATPRAPPPTITEESDVASVMSSPTIRLARSAAVSSNETIRPTSNVPNATNAANGRKLLPQMQHHITRSPPRPVPDNRPYHEIVESRLPVRVPRSANHPLTGNYYVHPDAFTPEVVVRGGFSQTRIHSNRHGDIYDTATEKLMRNNNSVIDRPGDPWPRFWAYGRPTHEDPFQPRTPSRVHSEVELSRMLGGV